MSPYPSPSAKWQAVRNRDPLATSAFVYCVKTTRIYCRPNCSARLARRSNVEFFEQPLAAQEAGYRACKRCRPELPSWEPAVDAVTAACATISAEVSKGNKPSLDNLAKSSGLTKWHFHRVFKKMTGFTPKDWADRARRDTEAASTRSITPHESPASATNTDVVPLDDLYESCSLLNDLSSSGLPLATASQFPQTPFTMDDLIDDYDLLWDSGTSASTDSVPTPISLDNLAPPQIFKLSPESSTECSPLYYTIRETNYGSILIGFKSGKICLLKMGLSEAELMQELHSEYHDLTTHSALVNADGTTASDAGATEFEDYVGMIVDALERPSGKTLNVPLSLASSFLHP